MGQLRLIADCIDELEQDIDQGVTVDRQQIATAVKRLQSLLARSSISINEIVPIQPLPGEPTQRLSKRLQLEVAYDYSNSGMPLNVLVFKALENYRFNDLLTIAQYTGIEQLKMAAEEVYGEALPRRLEQILRNIESGIRAAEEE